MIRCFASLIFILGSLCSSLNHADAKILVFGKTMRSAHAAIIPGAMLGIAETLGEDGFEVQSSQDPNVFTAERLKGISAIILIDVSEGVFTTSQKKAIERAVESGPGLVAIHASIALGKDWPWFQSKIGTLFSDHPPFQTATIRVVEKKHPSMQLVPETWSQTDEWYNFTSPLNRNQKVLAVVEEATYAGGKMGIGHPITWLYDDGKSRIWYTAMGHAEEFYIDSQSNVSKQILGATKWVTHSFRK